MHPYKLSLVVVLLAIGACERSVGPAPSPQPSLNPTPGSPPSPTQTDDLTGTYAVDLTMAELGSQCERVPDVVKHRSYDATITTTGTGDYTVSLSRGFFLGGPICSFAPSHLGCDQFAVTRTGDTLSLNLKNENDEGHGGHIVERVPQAGWIELTAGLTGTFDGGTINAAGRGTLWFCSTSAGYPFPCRSFVGCGVDDVRMTFAPR